jgi:hypothetical protein
MFADPSLFDVATFQCSMFAILLQSMFADPSLFDVCHPSAFNVCLPSAAV